MARERYRCPTCGSLAQAEDIAAAGSHHVEVRRVLRGLGRGKGFEWSREAATAETLEFLQQALWRAIAQVQQMAAAVAWMPPPPALCPACSGGLAWYQTRSAGTARAVGAPGRVDRR